MTDNQNPTAVVVNDDVTQLRVLSGLLRKDGFETQMFETAQDALAAMDQERPPDLIVTDLYMPGIDGWRFCRLLRSSSLSLHYGDIDLAALHDFGRLRGERSCTKDSVPLSWINRRPANVILLPAVKSLYA